MDQKTCNNCGVTKPITQDFPKNGNNYRSVCKICHCEKQKHRYHENHNEYLQRKKKQYETNKENTLERNKKYRQENRDIIREQKQSYYQNNKLEILQKAKAKDYKEKRNKYLQNRRKTDKKFAMVCAYRARLNEVLHKQKQNTYVTYLNCNREMFLNWIEFQSNSFYKWEDYGEKWVIDHVIPIDFFDFNIDEHVYKCFSWFNLRPCDKVENMKKSNKLIDDIVASHQEVRNNFKSINRYQADVEIHQWLREKLR